MMRDIKFRAYVRFMQEVHIVTELRRDGSVMTDGYQYAIEEDAVDLMQFTGLKDKNGVDIYEGDIVSSDFYLPTIECACAIKYKPTMMRFVFDDGEQDAYEYGNLTIIGNIHENKELLK